MGGMTTTTKDELQTALSDNFLEIKQSAARITRRNNDEEWQPELNKIIGLRTVRRQLEAKLRTIKNNPPSAH